MGNCPSSPPPAKLTLAEKRYRVSGLRRRSTRKTGNVTTTGCDMPFPRLMRNSSSRNTLQSEAQEDVPQENLPAEESETRESLDIDPRLVELYPQHTNTPVVAKPTSMFSVRSSSDINAANAILLTRTQRVLIENSWKKSRKTGADSVGARIFMSVITAQPDIKMLFELEKVPQGRLKYDPQFRKHAAVLTRAFDYIVKNLAYTDKLCHHFQALGRKHCQNHGRMIKPEYWDAFSEGITQSAIEESGYKCRETSMAWRSLVAFIIKQMRRGFDEEKTLRKRFSASLMGISSRNSGAYSNFGYGKSRSFRNMSEFRIASLSSLHSPAAYNRSRASSTISATNNIMENGEDQHKSVPSLMRPKPPPLNTLAPLHMVKVSPRSASWCTEQESFNAEFGRLTVTDMGRTTPNLKYSMEEDDDPTPIGTRRNSALADEYFTPPSSTRHQPASAQQKRASMPNYAPYPTYSHATSGKSQTDLDCVQFRVYDEYGSLASTSAPVLEELQKPDEIKFRYDEPNEPIADWMGPKKERTPAAVSHFPPMPRRSFSVITSANLPGNKPKEFMANPNGQLRVNHDGSPRKMSAL
ncbi:globin domain-containing protein [Ditylenchus destructor]|nr:globin domain-containing protein [Ditylenchus destructor]